MKAKLAPQNVCNCTTLLSQPSTYDHRTLKTRLPVRSALFKQRTGGLVVRWVTTGESPLLYVFCQTSLSIFANAIRSIISYDSSPLEFIAKIEYTSKR
jgi:hypothetical protein